MTLRETLKYKILWYSSSQSTNFRKNLKSPFGESIWSWYLMSLINKIDATGDTGGEGTGNGQGGMMH